MAFKTPEAKRAKHAEYMREYVKRPEVKVKVRAQQQRWVEQNRSRVRRAARAHRQRRAGLFITHQEELAIYEASDGLCALCYEEPAKVIDHDHETGQPRGALCQNCNKGIGFMQDSIARLQEGIEYLETSESFTIHT